MAKDTAAGWVVFALAGQDYAISVDAVERVLAAAEVRPLPGAPAIVLGLLDLHGEVLPVLDLQQRLGRPPRTLDVDDQFLVVRTPWRRLVLVIDEARGVVVLPAAEAGVLAAAGATFGGLVRLDGGLVLVHDIEQFLDVRESHRLELALEAAA